MDAKEKFSNKVEDYTKYRPAYPVEFMEYLENEAGVAKNTIVADIGAGTGILTRLLAGKANKVYAVEPNLNMRTACEKHCTGLENVIAMDGSAEDTGLAAGSVDFITAAQSFHWFDREKAKLEFQRILKPEGKVILVWNHRAEDSEFVMEYQELMRRTCPDFNNFSNGNDFDPRQYGDFFKNGYCEFRIFDNDRLLTLESYIGGSLSSSYAPARGDANYQEFVEGLTQLFNKYSRNGQLMMPYKTYSYVGMV